MNSAIRTDVHFDDADAFYEQLMDAHQGLTREQSEMLNARLILLLANQIGTQAVLAQCLRAAREMTDTRA